MAGKRLISRDVVRSERFLQLSDKAQLFYTHLMLEADDDGFIETPRQLFRILGYGEEELAELVQGHWIFTFPSEVIVIRHWKVQNKVTKTMYKPTIFAEELDMLTEYPVGVYSLKD